MPGWWVEILELIKQIPMGDLKRDCLGVPNLYILKFINRFFYQKMYDWAGEIKILKSPTFLFDF
jgi:hypothetical protein